MHPNNVTVVTVLQMSWLILVSYAISYSYTWLCCRPYFDLRL